MSRLVESCIVKSECFLDLLRLLALDHALETTNVKGIMYVGAQTSVAESLLQLCKRRNLEFYWEKILLQQEKNAESLRILNEILDIIRFKDDPEETIIDQKLEEIKKILNQ
mgnify:CR=1 FL=1